MTKKPEDRLGAVVSIRLPEEVKRMLVEEAIARKESLSNHVFNLIKTGWKTMQTKAGGSRGQPEEPESAPNEPKV
jgi:hypothetical protein